MGSSDKLELPSLFSGKRFRFVYHSELFGMNNC